MHQIKIDFEIVICFYKQYIFLQFPAAHGCNYPFIYVKNLTVHAKTKSTEIHTHYEKQSELFLELNSNKYIYVKFILITFFQIT